VPVTLEIRRNTLILTLMDNSAGELAQTIATAMSDLRFTVGTSMVLDVRLSTENPSTRDFCEWAHWLALQRAKGLSSRTAIVVDQKYEHQLGLALTAAVYFDNEGMDLRTFTDLDEAIQWLATGSRAARRNAG